MGRVGTHMTVASSGWGPSGRRFKPCLPDQFPESPVATACAATLSGFVEQSAGDDLEGENLLGSLEDCAVRVRLARMWAGGPVSRFG